VYSTCIFCDKPLGLNEVIEAFPVGRRLAFDPMKGRMWVVCGSCRRWNLTPMEERWEAVEECEILFGKLPARVHSPEIGLAAHPEGLRLIRIGKPLPVEFALYRYGETLGKRFRRNAYYAAAGLGVGAGLVAAGALMGFASAGLLYQAPQLVRAARIWRSRPAIRLPDGTVRKVVPDQVDLMNPSDEGGLRLRIRKWRAEPVVLEGPDAKRAASKIFPLLNHGGARSKTTEEAVSMLAETGGPEAFLAETWGKARPRPGASIRWVMSGDMRGGRILHLPPLSRIAFEMALHQEQERKAMEGELDELRAAWRAAEELAQISDNLLVPKEVEERVEALKTESKTVEGGPRRP
jgi:hypothetical protein